MAGGIGEHPMSVRTRLVLESRGAELARFGFGGVQVCDTYMQVELHRRRRVRPDRRLGPGARWNDRWNVVSSDSPIEHQSALEKTMGHPVRLL
jgi:hypothetical protein